MSDTQPQDPVMIEAQADFEAYRTNFEKKYNHGLALSIDITQDGRLIPHLQIIKLLPQPAKPTAELSEEDMKMAEVPDPETTNEAASTTPNADNTPEETSGSDSSELAKV